jgi:hypothetical protein
VKSKHIVKIRIKRTIDWDNENIQHTYHAIAPLLKPSDFTSHSDCEIKTLSLKSYRFGLDPDSIYACAVGVLKDIGGIIGGSGSWMVPY